MRPTSDRLRETLFNVLSTIIEGAVFIDLFAGTGAIGIEAISRGARQVYFAEPEKKALRIIRGNLQALAVDEGFEVLEREAASALRLLDSQAVRADICYLDPPYSHHGAYEQILGLLPQLQLLAPQGIVIAEHERFFDPGDQVGALERYRMLKQGDAVLSFYRKS